MDEHILAIHVENGDDLYAIKYLPLMLKGSARHWLHTLRAGSINTWNALHSEFVANFQGMYVKPADANYLALIKQKPDESVSKFWTLFLKKKNEIVDCSIFFTSTIEKFIYPVESLSSTQN